MPKDDATLSAASVGSRWLDTHDRMIGADEMLQTPHRLLTSTPTTNRSEAMAKSSKQIVWKSQGDQNWMGFVNGALRFSIRQVGDDWALSLPDAMGLFHEARVFRSADAAKEWAAR